MALKKCGFCGAKVPENGQCNKCGFIDGMARKPTLEEYKKAWDINKKNNYEQFENLDMRLLKAEEEFGNKK